MLQITRERTRRHNSILMIVTWLWKIMATSAMLITLTNYNQNQLWMMKFEQGFINVMTCIVENRLTVAFVHNSWFFNPPDFRSLRVYVRYIICRYDLCKKMGTKATSSPFFKPCACKSCAKTPRWKGSLYIDKKKIKWTQNDYFVILLWILLLIH